MREQGMLKMEYFFPLLSFTHVLLFYDIQFRRVRDDWDQGEREKGSKTIPALQMKSNQMKKDMYFLFFLSLTHAILKEI